MSAAPSAASQPPRIAAVVATFNGAQFLREQLASIRRQTVTPDRLVISDDGSTDETLSICAEFADAGDLPVSLVRRPSALASASRFDRISATFARGLGVVDGRELVALSDQDDVWHDDRLERSVAALGRAGSPSFVFGDGEVVDERGAPAGRRLSDYFPWPRDWNDLTPAEQLRFAIRRPFATGATMLLTPALLQAALPVPPGWLHDRWISVIGTALGGSRAADGALIRYRLHGGQHLGVSGSSKGQSRLREVVSRSGSVLGPVHKLRQVRERILSLDVTDDVRAEVGWPAVAGLVVDSVRGRRQ